MSSPSISEQSAYSILVEGMLEAFKSAIADLAEGEHKIVDAIIEGEEELGEKSSVVMVVSGPDNITHSGLRNLLHTLDIYACYLSSSPDDPDALKRLRNIAGWGYDLIMDDITLGGEVLKCIPRQVHPGFLRYGDTIYVGVLQTWQLQKREGFTLP